MQLQLHLHLLLQLHLLVMQATWLAMCHMRKVRHQQQMLLARQQAQAAM
jgi:hypothetical protein